MQETEGGVSNRDYVTLLIELYDQSKESLASTLSSREKLLACILTRKITNLRVVRFVNKYVYHFYISRVIIVIARKRVKRERSCGSPVTYFGVQNLVFQTGNDLTCTKNLRSLQTEKPPRLFDVVYYSYRFRARPAQIKTYKEASWA